MRTPFKLTPEQNGLHLKVYDLINFEVITEIKSLLHKKIDAGENKIIVDLSELKYMNSLGINLMVSLMSKARQANGDICIVNPNDTVMKLFQITKLDNIFNFSTSSEAAFL